MTEEKIRSKFWREVAEQDNPFVARACYCAGYDVYGDVLNKANWVEYLYLLAKGVRPTEKQEKLLNGIAIALANPGPKDHSVRGAMDGAVGGSTAAACLISALGIGAGNYGGAREIFHTVKIFSECRTNISKYQALIDSPSTKEIEDIWREMEHVPGFDPYGNQCALPVVQTLSFLAQVDGSNTLSWLQQNRATLEKIANMPLSMVGVAAACFIDLEFNEDESEMIYLLLRLPGAAVHALEQKIYGWRQYPFFANAMNLENDPHHSSINQLQKQESHRELALHE